MKKYNIFFLFLLVATISLTSPVATQAAADNTIVIGVESGKLAYNVTSINLDTNTKYTIIFVNNDAFGATHNLRIDTNDNIKDGDVADSADIVIGVANDADGAAGKADGSANWTGTYTTGGDGEVTFYCGFAGHYTSGMEGKFIVGEGKKTPGFGLFLSGIALVISAAFITNYRRR